MVRNCLRWFYVRNCLRWFYARAGRWSFHTAKIQLGHSSPYWSSTSSARCSSNCHATTKAIFSSNGHTTSLDLMVSPSTPLPQAPQGMKLHVGGKERREGWVILDALPGAIVDYVGNCNDVSRR
jgi:hypothetical protein